MGDDGITTLHLTVSKLLFREALMLQLIKLPNIRVVGESSHGAEALRVLSVAPAEILFIEEELEDNDGLTIAETARTKFPWLNVLLVVEKPVRQSRMAVYLESGVRAVVPKTAAMKEMLKALTYVSYGQTYIDPDMHWKHPLNSDRKSVNAMSKLSEREQEVARQLAQNRSIKSIALDLGVSQKTVHTYKDRILIKLEIGGFTELLVYLNRIRQTEPALFRGDFGVV